MSATKVAECDNTYYLDLAKDAPLGSVLTWIEGVDFTLKEATAYDITVAANLTPSTLAQTMLVKQTTTGAVTITYPSPPLNTIRLVASTNTSDHDSTTNGLIKYTFVQ